MSRKNASEPDSEDDTSRPPQLVGYARVSTNEQNLDLQTAALERAGCITVYSEKLSAKSKRRPELDLAIKDLVPGDTLVVWRLDRFARSIRDLVVRLEQIEAAKASFRSLTESFDTTSPAGRFMLHILGAVAELEAQLIGHRTAAGIKILQEQGHKFGAKRKFTDAKRAKARAMLAETRIVIRGGKKLKRPKYSRRGIAARLEISYQTLYDWIKRGYK
jgi:DNA invertase Pin-like site-specific DNA recombinase